MTPAASGSSAPASRGRTARTAARRSSSLRSHGHRRCAGGGVGAVPGGVGAGWSRCSGPPRGATTSSQGRDPWGGCWRAWPFQRPWWPQGDSMGFGMRKLAGLRGRRDSVAISFSGWGANLFEKETIVLGPPRDYPASALVLGPLHSFEEILGASDARRRQTPLPLSPGFCHPLAQPGVGSVAFDRPSRQAPPSRGASRGGLPSGAP